MNTDSRTIQTGFSMELENYRQPWENSRQWEIKKEFLEFYKDFFPDDKLQCLAQVYSNIELLQCSYPIQVMTQVQKLARHLKAFKIATSSQNSEQNGKRKILEPESFEYKKQCKKVEKEQYEREEEQEMEERHECLPFGLKSVDYKSLLQSEHFDILQKLTTEVQKLLKLQKENAVDLILSAALHLNIEDLIDFKYTQYPTEETDPELVTYYCEFFIETTKLAIGGGKNRYIAKKNALENALNTLSNLPLIEKLGTEVQKLLLLKDGDSGYDLILRAAISLGMEDSVIAKFDTCNLLRRQPHVKKPQQYCELFIGATKIGYGFGTSSNLARKCAGYKAVSQMALQKDLPTEMLKRNKNNFRRIRRQAFKRGTYGKWDRELLEALVLEIKRKEIESPSILHTIDASFGRIGKQGDLVFNFFKDVNPPMGEEDLFTCEVMVNGVPMGRGKATTKKKAKVVAAQTVMNFYLNLFETMKKSSDSTEDICMDFLRLMNEPSYRTPLNMKRIFVNETTGIVMSDTVPTATLSLPGIAKVKTVQRTKDKALFKDGSNEVENSINSFTINKRLYDNSIKQNLLLFDRSEIPNEEHTLFSHLSYTARQCHKILGFDYIPQTDQTQRVDVLLDHKVIGTGIAASKAKAKNEAAKIVIEKLRKEVYTVKVKVNSEEVLEINPSDLVRLKFVGSKQKAGSKRQIICTGNEKFGKVFQHYANLSKWVSLTNIKTKIATLLDGYSKSDDFVVLKFSEKFLLPEKKAIHHVRKKLGLMFNKCQKKTDKNIYIKRKIKVKDILKTLIESGGKTSKYELVDMSN